MSVVRPTATVSAVVWWRRSDDVDALGRNNAARVSPVEEPQGVETSAGDSWSGLPEQDTAAGAQEQVQDVPSGGPVAPLPQPLPSTTEASGPGGSSPVGGHTSEDEHSTSGQTTRPTSEPDVHNTAERRNHPMADYTTALNDALNIEGALGVALVDSQSGMALATAGNPPGLDLNVAAAGNSNVIQAKIRTMADLGLRENIEDILITLDTQYHIIRTFGRQEGMFLYLVLDKNRANLAMARFRLAKVEKELDL